MILDKVNQPSDLRALGIEELNDLATEIRAALMKKMSERGGHFGPNFGMVEATIALHYVLDSPRDKIVFDVSHQSYVHKMLTGRKLAYLDPEHYDEVSGFTNPDESEHDLFNIGHTSTAVPLAAGLVTARDLKGNHENVVAVIGDGSLSGGEAFEGFDFAGTLKSNFIIIVNDNEMSIAENHGGIYENLKTLRETNGNSHDNLFKAMGLDYIYQGEGNNIEKLIETFESVKDIDHPIVVHIHTEKSHGFAPAVRNKEAWHFAGRFDINTGEFLGEKKITYNEIISDYLLERMKNDPELVVITAGVPKTLGFNAEKREKAGKQFIDVGIAEECAVALASGIAKGGGRPIFGVAASFMQRTYDQLSQDLCINKNPATILVNSASVFGMNDVTHLGIFDIPMISNIPNLVYLAPTSKAEYLAMLNWSIEQTNHPVAIRIPCNGVVEDGRAVDENYDDLNKFKIEQSGEKVAVVALGDFYQLGEDVIKSLAENLGIQATLINPRFITGLDEEMLTRLTNNHQLVISLEDGVLDGGFGEKIARFYGDSSMKVKCYGLKKEFIDRYDPLEVLRENRLTPEQIVEDAKQTLNL